ncbi:hypothetical protein CO009_01890 [Candidatus Shapirobacteria bacterium CG_4_8_14_3_um_filter_35_11]|uniref:HTH cro/C1-type domain-containing protein n=6 Tax=Candidatus Shapironibacteriota TaxID=1752721 RepID=A0A1J5I0N5_9BACT|nr:MAG: hypothetical protein AUK05_03170 [Candidatus Shapirobacteria bacterium CG2_30_35_20]PIV07255.1 MAG: hypothetical protein COS53_02760 [Candidatus Shapirobacteria bacterium CG03_land_8_20_14_0_80_35_14]PIX67813.1 MAG: hypothetical protein COZ41_03035 [Candidatus Shapirobacteria bacterium CG_4_10_14_3_um_filter_35_13]PJA50891.1 MAG: hypothetical protein CO168_02720 [Candidatus Shapirobacteria bacterium CG_4_9_14_3_um_filter_36_12]PJC80428.1 MAG: hypothetical protein CO009_01890 [Candidatus
MNFLGNIRTKNNWTQAEMASFIGVSRPTYISLERGDISITIDQLNKLADKMGCDSQDILQENIINEQKYKDVLLESIRYGADTDGKITKTKLAKLIYLNDFGWYYNHLESMTGARYRRLAQGPVPNFYFSAIDDLFEKGIINIEIKESAQLITLTEAGNQVKSGNLKKEESEFIKKIAKKWQKKRTNEIVAFTHEQLPYKICSPGEVIPYELITQQEPEYVY